MKEQRPGMFLPALLGGGAAGILSGIPLVNCLCCLWVIGGGIMAVYFLNKNAKTPLTPGDGAVVGALAGLIASVVDILISIPFQRMSSEIFRHFMEKLSEYANNMPENWEQMFEQSYSAPSLPWMMTGFLISAVIFIALGLLGGIIGISLFKKKTREPLLPE